MVETIGFEGPEKSVEIWFSPPPKSPSGPSLGLRVVSRDTWQDMLDIVGCKILNHIGNEHVDAYLLSESSMFIWPYKIIVRSCGTTTPLKALQRILDIAREQCGLTRVESFFFSRKKFYFPEVQQHVHTSFRDEVDFLDQYFEDGAGYIVGKVNDDHWNLYLTPNRKTTLKPGVQDITFEVLMTELDQNKVAFFSDPYSVNEMYEKSGISELFPMSQIDHYKFSPLGYSINGIQGDGYWTIHITPEAQCSYASFETNIPHGTYGPLLKAILRIFAPHKFSLSMFHDAPKNYDPPISHVWHVPGYERQDKIGYSFGHYDLHFYHFTTKDSAPSVRPLLPPASQDDGVGK